MRTPQLSQQARRPPLGQQASHLFYRAQVSVLKGIFSCTFELAFTISFLKLETGCTGHSPSGLQTLTFHVLTGVSSPWIQ